MCICPKKVRRRNSKRRSCRSLPSGFSRIRHKSNIISKGATDQGVCSVYLARCGRSHKLWKVGSGGPCRRRRMLVGGV